MSNPNDWDNKRELQQTLLKAYDCGLHNAASTKAVKRELAIELALRNKKGFAANNGHGDYGGGGTHGPSKA